jgi:hypothetical protein
VTLKDGSVIYGEVLEMAGGILLLKNASNPDNLIKLKWEDVKSLTVTHPIPFHLREGTILNGTAAAGADGVLVIHAEPLTGTMDVPFTDVKAVNPLVQAPQGTAICVMRVCSANWSPAANSFGSP